MYMANETLIVPIDSETREELDMIAFAQDRNRSYVVNEAIRAYLHHWRLERIDQGLRDADEGRFLPEAVMKGRSLA
jgi:predicted transcriptional regulator